MLGFKVDQERPVLFSLLPPLPSSSRPSVPSSPSSGLRFNTGTPTRSTPEPPVLINPLLRCQRIPRRHSFTSGQRLVIYPTDHHASQALPPTEDLAAGLASARSLRWSRSNSTTRGLSPPSAQTYPSQLALHHRTTSSPLPHALGFHKKLATVLAPLMVSPLAMVRTTTCLAGTPF